MCAGRTWRHHRRTSRCPSIGDTADLDAVMRSSRHRNASIAGVSATKHVTRKSLNDMGLFKELVIKSSVAHSRMGVEQIRARRYVEMVEHFQITRMTSPMVSSRSTSSGRSL